MAFVESDLCQVQVPGVDGGFVQRLDVHGGTRLSVAFSNSSDDPHGFGGEMSVFFQ